LPQPVVVYSANNRDVFRTASRSPWLETILVMKTAKNRSSDDTVVFTNPVAGQRRRDVKAIGNARSQARMWTPAIVMRHSFAEGAAKVNLVDRNHPVQALAPRRPNHPFAECVGLRRS